MKTIQNPILRGFCPDPCMIRTGDDYYIATSTFEWWPCVNLYHSKDLAHWEQLPSPLREPGQMDLRGDPNSGGIFTPVDRKSTRLNSSHMPKSRMPSSA